MDNICRICCSKTDTKNYIFSNENTLYFKMLYLPINIIKNDLLPQNVCDECCFKINDYYEFCIKAIKSEKKLGSKLKNKTNGLKETVTEDCSTKKEQDDFRTNVDHSSDNAIEIKLEPTNSYVDIEVSDNFSADEDDFKIIVDQSSDKISEIKEEPTNHDVDEIVVSNNFSADEDDFITKVDPSPDKTLEMKKEPINIDCDDMSPSITYEYISNLSDKLSADNCSDSSDDMLLVNLKKKITKSKNNIQNSHASPQTRKSKRLPNNISYSECEKPGNVVKGNKKLGAKNSKTDSDVEENSNVVHTCCMCFKKYYSRNEILAHYRSHAKQTGKIPKPPPKPEKCPKCSMVLKTVYKWNLHWRRHWLKEMRPYTCALCDKSYFRTQYITDHALTHNYDGETKSTIPAKNYLFLCDLCPEKFFYTRYFLSHRAKAHPEASSEAVLFRCSKCPKTYSAVFSLRRHMRDHNAKVNVLCNICGKMLSTPRHLYDHMRKHKGIKRHICKTCGKRFDHVHNLKTHERIHTKEKPFVCKECGKGFSQKSTLTVHERCHSGVRPYVCKRCKRGFIAQGLLTMHVKTCCL